MSNLINRILARTQKRILDQIDLAKIADPSPGELSRTLETWTGVAARQDARNRLSLDFDLLEIEALDELDDLALSAELETMAAQVATFNARGVSELTGINVRAESGLGARIDMFRDTNVGLIRSLVGNQIQDVRSMLEEQESLGLRVEELRAQIEERFSVSQSKADLIARDQTLKLASNITQARQRNAGVEKYIWTTSGDERVREEHADLEGQVFSWDDPPSVGHPGEDFQCRCTAFPIIEEFDDEKGLELGLVDAGGAINSQVDED
jgi:SPP1 gp7 family putative phage head morphogenesis protein